MRDFFRSPLFRCLICLILVCCVLVNVSPIRADAFAGGAALTAVVGSAAAVAVVASAIHALGVMPDSTDTSVFEGVVNDCVSALTASGVFLNGMVSVLQLSDGVHVKNHVNEGIIQAILDWLFAEEVVLNAPIPFTLSAGTAFNYTYDGLSSKIVCTVASEPFYYYFSCGDEAFDSVVLYSGTARGSYKIGTNSYNYSPLTYNGFYFYPGMGTNYGSLPDSLPDISNIPDSNKIILGSFDNKTAGLNAVYDTIIGMSTITVSTGLVAGQIGADIKTDYETWVEEGVVAADFGIGYVDDPNTHNDDEEDGDDDTGTEIGPTVPPGELDPPSPDTQVAPSPSPSPWWKNNKWLNIGDAIVGWELAQLTRYLLHKTQTDVQTGTADPQYKPDTSLFGNGGNGNNVITPPSTGDPDPSNPTTPSDPEISVDFPMMFDLKDFFPFCIPFDLYDFFSVLDAPPEAPQFHWELRDLSGNIYPIDVDLSTWDDLASFFRKLQLFLFITGLAAATRKYIKW